MRKVELFFAALLLPLDYLMLLLAGWLAYAIRFDETVAGLRPVIYALPWHDYSRILLLSSLGMVLIFAWNGLYDITSTRQILNELRKVFLACSTGVMVVIVLIFFNRDLFSSRFIILLTWIFSIALVCVMRFSIIQLERALLRKGIGVHQILLIGHNRTAATLQQAIQSSPTLGFRIVEQANEITPDLLTKLNKILQIKHIDELIVADPNLTRQQAVQCIEFCKAHHIQFKYTADMFDTQMKNMSIRPLAGIPLVETHATPLQGWGRIYKRLFDIIVSALVLLILSPVLLVVAIILRLDSIGPAVYRNQRVGENGKVFNTLKFRSMYQQYCIGEQFNDTEQALKLEQKLIQERSIKAGPIYKIKDDPRVTKFGAFLRKTSLDELPQFFNVLKGEMSLVGPRPHQPREVEGYAQKHHAVLNIKPGITGLAQISGRSDLEFEEEMRLDTYYVENWNGLLDWYIFFKTPFVLFKKRRAL